MLKRLLRASLNNAESTSILEKQSKESTYSRFDSIDGTHPWQGAVPDGYVLYPVRKLDKGKVFYFNFSLAREMGLLPKAHPDHLTPELESKILETFNLQIVNEYDQQNRFKLKKHNLKQHSYMATRYLQLQHSNKAGKTSGDGRSIWNGSIENNGQIWDISSRGTGVTCLAPGAVEANRPLKTGGSEFGYGCGQADLSELIGSALLSESFHLNQIGTERTLAIIDLGKGCGIGVRAAKNLLRPAHLFLYLKQDKFESLKRACDYLIDRQFKNGEWQFSSRSKNKYDLMLRDISTSYARFVAQLERNYIFTWLDWDGDNVLTSAGIIDYGSIRQFGLRHDQYRYDDVQRFSTTLNEQSKKGRLIIQVFTQIVDYLKTGRRKKLGSFAHHKAVLAYQREYEHSLRLYFLQQVGLSDNEANRLLKSKTKLVNLFYLSYLGLEATKTKSKIRPVADGINRPAIFNMRLALRDLPEVLLDQASKKKNRSARKNIFNLDHILDNERLHKAILSKTFAKKKDRILTPNLKSKLTRFQHLYLRTLKAACGNRPPSSFLKSLSERAQEHNRPARLTGNASEFIVEEIMEASKKGLAQKDIYSAMELLLASQVPRESLNSTRKAQILSLDSPAGRLFQSFMEIATQNEEDI